MISSWPPVLYYLHKRFATLLSGNRLCNYADNTTIYACDKTLDSVIVSLESDSSIVIQWFGDNFMKLNADRCHLLILGRNPNQQVTLDIGDSAKENTDEEKLLGVVIDKKLTFDTTVSKLCKNAGIKLFALARIAGSMDPIKLGILIRAFVVSQFQYCPLVWMFQSRHLHSKINRMDERALRIAHNDYQSTFNILLENSCSVNMHVKNLQTLMNEMFKTKENLNPLS